MSRVGDSAVRDFLSGSAIRLDPLFKTDPHIRRAAKLVQHIEANDDVGLLDEEDLFEIELTLSCGFCMQVDQGLYSQRSTGGRQGAGAAFQTGVGGLGPFETNDLLRTAMGQDFTGTLAKINTEAKHGSKKATLNWMGKPPSTQTDYIDRD
jgi:hypothetical protein